MYQYVKNNDTIVKYPAKYIKGFMENDDIFPVGFHSFWCKGKLFDGEEFEINLQNALAHSIVLRIIKKNKNKWKGE